MIVASEGKRGAAKRNRNTVLFLKELYYVSGYLADSCESFENIGGQLQWTPKRKEQLKHK